MTLRFIGTTSEFRATWLTDPEHLTQLRNVGEHETFVITPRKLLTRFAPKE